MGNVLKDTVALQAIFFDDEMPLWRMYSGGSAKGKKIGENMDDTDMESSWAALETRLSYYDDGVFTIATMKKSGTNNSGANIHTVKLGTGKTSTSLTSTGNVGTQLDHLIKLNEFMSKKQENEIAGTYDAAREDFDKDMKMMKMEMEIERLKSGSAFEKVISGCIEKLPQILNQFYPADQTAGVLGTMGFAGGKDDDTVTEEETEVGHMDLNQLVNDASRLQELMPNQNVNTLLHKLVNFVEKNPAQAKMMFSQL